MDLVYNNTTDDLSVMDDVIEGEQFQQLTYYTRKRKGGGHIDAISYVVASRGKSDLTMWVKDYLSEEKEKLYLSALRNMYKKLDFIELNQSLEMEDITEEEYDKELVENEKDYLISSPNTVPTVQQIIQVTDIIKRLGREKKATVDEVSELFSLEMGKAMNVLEEKHD